MNSAGARFPRDFLWGAATSAYQIEGSPLADGAGPSNWHRFSHSPGMTRDGQTGDVACDHYRRWPEDVEWMSRLGLNAYRFSISWSRVLPEGTGAVNGRGLDFYSRLVDRLLEKSIRPCVTLFHWDLPAALEDRGGWLNPDIAGWFADYAGAVSGALGDRVKMWMTINEPWVVVDAGYLFGAHAPGHRSPFEAPLAAHNLLRSHGAAVKALRAGGSGKVGLAVNLEPKEPASDAVEDRRAAARADAYMNRWFLDAIFRKSYPEELAHIFGEAWPAWSSRDDFESMAQPLDFLGVNYYTRGVVRAAPGVRPLPWRQVKLPGRPHTDTGWEVRPEGLTAVLRWVRDRYGDLPLYVTENGAAFPDPPAAPSSPVGDPPRVEYLRQHILAAGEAMAGGVDLRGYFVWSLLDNYEWACGYSMRFGLLHVDFESLKRTPRESAFFYRDVIRGGGSPPWPAGPGGPGRR